MKNISFNSEIYTHQSSLKVFAMRFTQNLEDANDLVQDTLLKAIRYHNLYKDGTNLRGWLFTIMKNTYINTYRKATVHRALIDTEEDLTSIHLLKSSSRNEVENKFISDDIFTALKTLEPVYYAPFMRYFEGYKYHEIAEELDIPIGTVKTRIHMARKVLKNALKMYGETYSKSIN
jgi:RNA polymerase sigma factor (sigma-70 family)